jgi:small nuclear ribonucleoprotein (snRNP)-like protein
MDSLKYWYQYINTAGTVANYDPAAPPTLNNVREFTNKLAYVGDLVPTTNYTTDIENQVAGNYDYDEIGNLTKDVNEKITYIGWTVYGKIDSIEKSTSTAGQVKRISYRYDAMGNRLSKRVVKVGSAIVDFTYYVRDASGNVMSVYNYAQDSTTAATALTAGTLNLIESHLYGSSRLGVLNRLVNVEVNTINSIIFTRGNKFFELANHLGNVLVTISDRKVQNGAFGGAATFYTADVKTANDYYPFGMNMPGRSFAASAATKYRYSINGQEKDSELNDNITTALYWEYDSRIGRRWNTDPVVKEYESSYLCFGGNPIAKVDFNGDDDFFDWTGKFLFSTDKGTQVRVIRRSEIINAVNQEKPRKKGESLEDARNRVYRAASVHAVTLTQAEVESRDINDYYKTACIQCILSYYGKKVGANGHIYTYSTNKKDDNAIASTNINEEGRPISFNTNVNGTGRMDEGINDKNYLMSTINHEKGHQIRGEVKSFLDHANIFLDYEIKSDYFGKISEDQQRGLVSLYSQRLLNHFVVIGEGGEQENRMLKIIADFNKLKKGYTLSIQFDVFDNKKAKITYTDSKNNSYEVEYKAIKEYQ